MKGLLKIYIDTHSIAFHWYTQEICPPIGGKAIDCLIEARNASVWVLFDSKSHEHFFECLHLDIRHIVTAEEYNKAVEAANVYLESANQKKLAPCKSFLHKIGKQVRLDLLARDFRQCWFGIMQAILPQDCSNRHQHNYCSCNYKMYLLRHSNRVMPRYTRGQTLHMQACRKKTWALMAVVVYYMQEVPATLNG